MSDEIKFMSELFRRYKEAIEANEEYDVWCFDNPDKFHWHYKGDYVPKEKIKRLGLMLRQEMIEYEKLGR